MTSIRPRRRLGSGITSVEHRPPHSGSPAPGRPAARGAASSPMTDHEPSPGAPQHVLITGASSGIGAALALAYAAPGGDVWRCSAATRAASARSPRSAGRGCALVAAMLVDVTDAEAMAAAVTLVDDAHPVDLVIANAGIAGTMLGGGRGVAHLFAVNVMGVVHTVEPLLPRHDRSAVAARSP